MKTKTILKLLPIAAAVLTAMIFALIFMPSRTANAAGAYSMTINNFDVEYVIGSDRTIAV